MWCLLLCLQGQKPGFFTNPLGYATQDLILPPRGHMVPTDTLKVFKTSTVHPLISNAPDI